MRAKTGLFGWHDMNTVALQKSESFYGSLFGWHLDEESRPNGYRVLSDGGQAFGGMMEWPPEVPQRSHWTGYVLVEDVVDVATRAKALGGGAPFDSMPIPGAGTLGVVFDPTGAPLTTFRPEPGMEWGDLGAGGTGGAVLWNELITTDLGVSTAFHCELFGWSVDQSVVDAGGYVIARVDGRPVAGIFQTEPPPASSDWVTYFGVQDIAAAQHRVESLGGQIVHRALEVPNVGRTAWMRDPNGAVFGLMQPLEGWYEKL